MGRTRPLNQDENYIKLLTDGDKVELRASRDDEEERMEHAYTDGDGKLQFMELDEVVSAPDKKPRGGVMESVEAEDTLTKAEGIVLKEKWLSKQLKYDAGEDFADEIGDEGVETSEEASEISESMSDDMEIEEVGGEIWADEGDDSKSG